MWIKAILHVLLLVLFYCVQNEQKLAARLVAAFSELHKLAYDDVDFWATKEMAEKFMKLLK